jgi:uncharacterized coiled-coil protein SlyX
MIRRSGPLAVLLVMFLCLPPAPEADAAITTVTKIAGGVVTIGAGAADGIELGTQVQLLRNGPPIVHPLTGEVLGSPQEPVGTLQVVEVSPRQSTGRIVRSYSDPQVDDVGEYSSAQGGASVAVASDRAQVVGRDEQESSPRSAPAPAAELELRLAELAGLVSQNQRAIGRLTRQLAAQRQPWDEIASMRAALAGVGERLTAVETLQAQTTADSEKAASAGMRDGALRTLTVNYEEGIAIKVGHSGRQLRLVVVRDSLVVDSASPATSPGDGPVVSSPETTSSFVGPSSALPMILVVLLVAAGMAFLLLRPRRQAGVGRNP